VAASEFNIAIVLPPATPGGAERQSKHRCAIFPFEDLGLAEVPEWPGVYFLCRQLDDRSFEGGQTCSRYHILFVGIASSGFAVRFRRPMEQLRLFNQLGGTHVFMVECDSGDADIAALANVANLRPLMNTDSWKKAMPGMNCIICWHTPTGRSKLHSLIPGNPFHLAEVSEMNEAAAKFINKTVTSF